MASNDETENDPISQDSTRDGHRELLAEIGQATLTAGAIDAGLVILLGALLASKPGVAGHLASVFIYEAKSFDQRIKIVNGTFDVVFGHAMRKEKTDNLRRSVEFLGKLKGRVFDGLNQNRWIRNMAAHGSISLVDGKPLLIPGLWDFSTEEAMKRRGFQGGMTAAQIRDRVAILSEDQINLTLLGYATKQFVIFFPATPVPFLEAANALASRLKIPRLSLQDPLAGPPLRRRREKKGRP